MVMTMEEIRTTPCSVRISRPPTMVPINMEINVPASIRPVPPTSSSSLIFSGRMPYLMGPKNVDWVPMRKSTVIRKPTLSR